MTEEMARFVFSGSSSFVEGEGWVYFLFYSDQDCSWDGRGVVGVREDCYERTDGETCQKL